ncbi:deubiquitinase SseL [Serratia sp. M24T3]|uniref:deubiquitinase SseL n=1 Tax=Serratia sp. M24T3 TaxID=932213 RepID=UPI00025B95F2|nr:deubiquitinase SseL [Serratia sp. M24T3]EIC84476.1 deubiquitinase SseL [Serratia sp. M24T3]
MKISYAHAQKLHEVEQSAKRELTRQRIEKYNSLCGVNSSNKTPNSNSTATTRPINAGNIRTITPEPTNNLRENIQQVVVSNPEVNSRLPNSNFFRETPTEFPSNTSLDESIDSALGSLPSSINENESLHLRRAPINSEIESLFDSSNENELSAVIDPFSDSPNENLSGNADDYEIPNASPPPSYEEAMRSSQNVNENDAFDPLAPDNVYEEIAGLAESSNEHETLNVDEPPVYEDALSLMSFEAPEGSVFDEGPEILARPFNEQSIPDTEPLPDYDEQPDVANPAVSLPLTNTVSNLNSYQRHVARQESSSVSNLKLPDLEWRAVSNDPSSNDAIDMLFTYACGGLHINEVENTNINDKNAKRAESFLFNLFTGKKFCANQLEMQKTLEDKSLDLFELVEEQNRLHGDNIAEYWVIPTKLLIIAGFKSPYGDEDHRPNVSKKLNQNIAFNAIFESNAETVAPLAGDNASEARAENAANIADKELFLTNRYIHAAELDAFSKKLNADYPNPNIKFHEAREIKITNSNGINEPIFDNLLTRSFINNSARDFTANFAPILLNDHWYLFGTYYDQNGIKSALIFDSQAKVNSEQTKGYFDKLAEECGVIGDMPPISEELQGNVPNGCGLFVAKAMENLAAANNDKYALTLRNWTRAFELESEEYQQLFNRQGRAELINTLGDALVQQLN